MSLKNSKYREMIVKYHTGELSNRDMHKLELDAMSDPFLNDALESAQNASSLACIESIESDIYRTYIKKTDNGFYKKFILAFVIILTLSLLLNPRILDTTEPRPKNHINNITTKSNHQEEEKTTCTEQELAETLEQSRVLPKKDWIQNLEIKSIKKPVNKPLTALAPIGKNNPKHIENNNHNKPTLKKKHHPVYYLFDLKVANYKGYRSENITNNNMLYSLLAKYENEEITSDFIMNKSVAYSEFLEDCILDFSNSKLKKALVGLNMILKTYPDDANALFYSGLCYYNLGVEDKAIELFKSSYNHSFKVFQDESEWYLALSLIKSGHRDRGMEIIQTIANKEQFYREKAKQKLNSVR